MRYSEKWPEYAKQWDRMVIKADRTKEFKRIADQLFASKARYLEIENATRADSLSGDVTWFHVALLHYRESSANFGTYLGNGQSLARRTTIVPKGRGPFTGPKAFLNGALDALHIDGLDRIIDWRLEKILYYCEVFNGAGYHNKGLPSPYIWGGTNIQKPGKYIADGRFSSATMDPQPGCAAILATMAKIDPSIKFVRET